MFLSKINNWLLINQSCVLCGFPGADPHGICADCHADLPWLLSRCRGCALPLPPFTPPGSLCGRCLKESPCFDHVVAAFNYDFPISQLLPRIKYRRQPGHLGWMGRVFATFLREQYEQEWPDALVAVPMHPLSEFTRGFNQARLLANVLSSDLKLPLCHCLMKTRRTPQQMTLGLNERRQNLQHAFKVTRQPPRHLAVVDDVMTTGTTANTLAGLLKSAGAQQVDIWVLARTPEVR